MASFLGGIALCYEKLPESYYRDRFCENNGGRTEVVMPDRTRADCVTDTHAVEVEFAPKWLEAVGQSLNYASHGGKRAAILILCRRPTDKKKLKFLKRLVEFYSLPIDVFSEGCE